MIDFYRIVRGILVLSHKMNKQQTNNPANDQTAKWENREKRYHHELNILLRETFIKQGNTGGRFPVVFNSSGAPHSAQRPKQRPLLRKQNRANMFSSWAYAQLPHHSSK